jgi:hypothetical protein
VYVSPGDGGAMQLMKVVALRGRPAGEASNRLALRSGSARCQCAEANVKAVQRMRC